MKRNSTPAKLYRYFYSTDKMPSAWCTYLFKYLLLIIGIVPITIFLLPCYILEFIWCHIISYGINDNVKNDTGIESQSERLQFTGGIYGLIILASSIVLSIVNLFINIKSAWWLSVLVNLGNVINIILILALLIWIRSFYDNKKSSIKSYFKNKNPKINWE